jgi:hypothetical protein
MVHARFAAGLTDTGFAISKAQVLGYAINAARGMVSILSCG